MKRTLTLLIVLLLPFFLHAQSDPVAEPGAQNLATSGFCLTDQLAERAAKDHKWNLRHQSIEESIYQHFKYSGTDKGLAPTTYTLPVVVHIIHDNGAENISDATVLQGIQDLNDAFANVGYYDPNTGVDTEIQFCLAQRDPDGNTTTGINRVESPLTEMVLETDDITVKDLSRWDPLQYINIWLVREICSSGYGCGVAGYAYFPASHGGPEDGIMMEAVFFGSSQGNSGVQVHEMGHYLGLYHTFQGGCVNNDCLNDGDRVCDTPPDGSTAAIPCSSTVNSCTTDANSGFPSDQDDLFQAYMDYGDFDCWSIFTQGQADRMSWHIENVRFSLLDSPGCQDPCLNPVSAAFMASDLSVPVGSNVDFTNISQDASTADWSIDGMSFSSDYDTDYTFTSVGTFEICLTAGNGDVNCADEFCQLITVTCPVQAEFGTAVFYPNPGQTVTYTNTSLGASGYTWTVDGVAVGSGVNLSYTWPSTGVYDLCLEADNGLCTASYCIPVFVTEGLISGCDEGFLKYIGDDGTEELSRVLIDLPGGDLLVGGRRGNSSLLMRLSPQGDLIWERTFDMTSGNDFINKMLLDSEGFLLASGRDQQNSATLNFIFRYDYINDVMLWVRNMPDPAFTRIEEMLENPQNQNFILTGLSQNPATSIDVLVMEIDRTTGAENWIRYYDSGSTTEVSNGARIYNNELYLATNLRFGTSLDKIRAGLSKLDLSGTADWHRIYFKDEAGSARQYTYDLQIANDTIVAFSQGDINGQSTNNYSVQFFATDIDGNVYWARDYEMGAGTSFHNARSILPLPDGYILQGSYEIGGARNIFIMRVDKQGFPLWARGIGGLEEENSFSAILHQGMIYFTGSTEEYDPGNNDVLFGSMTVDGQIVGSGCQFVTEIEPTLNLINDPYDGFPVVEEPVYDYNLPEVTGNATAVNLPIDFFPDCECVVTSECDTTFLKSYGTVVDDEVSHAIALVPQSLGGGYLLGGGKADSAMITLVDPAGDIVWTRSFDATFDAADFIWDIRFDSDDNVVGVGQTKDEPLSNIECLAFKYDLVNNQILWINELDLFDPAHEQYYSIQEKAPGGNYIVAGSVDQLNGGSGCDGVIVELDRNNGANVWQNNYTLGSCETFRRIILADGGIYTTGRYNFDGGGTNRMRPGVTKFDLNGNELWSRLYLEPVTFSDNARLYSNDLVEDNGLVIVGFGDDDGSNTSDVVLFMYKTDLNGNLLWARQYDLPGSNTERAYRILNLPDGYVVLGSHITGDQDAFIFKTDKQGQIVWSKSFSTDGLDDAWDMVWNNGQIFITGSTTGLGTGSSEDMYLVNLAADGTSNAQDSCNLFTDLTMTDIAWSNPYDAPHPLTNLNQTWGFFLDQAIMGETAVQSTIACFNPCVDSCDLVPEASILSLIGSCEFSDINITMEICNDGNFDLPAGTSVTIYQGDPTAAGAVIVETFNLVIAVPDGECLQIAHVFPGDPNIEYYVLVDEDGTSPLPLDLAEFTGPAQECDYTNNIGSFSVDYTIMPLDLGPDVFSCENGVVELDAGPGFASYEWSDGSTMQTLTAFFPGTYWVDVTDECGFVQSDTITITVDPATVLDLGPDLVICEGGSFQFDLSGFDVWEWTPSDYLSCDDCPNPTVEPEDDITYTVVGTTADGCISADSVSITLEPGFTTSEEIDLCDGQTIVIFGEEVSEAGEYSETFTATNGCDSTHTVVVTLLDNIATDEELTICDGETVDIFGEPIGDAGVYEMTFEAENGCDSTHTVTLTVLDNTFTEEALTICDGQTVDIFGEPIGDAGVYEMTFAATNGCDSTHTVTLTVLDNIFTEEDIFLCFGETTEIFGETVAEAGEYSMTFAAANGCDSTHTVNLTINDEIGISAIFSEPTCFGDTDGAISLQAAGGSGGFTYEWSDGTTGSLLSDITAGTYSVTLTDAAECTFETSLMIGEPTPVEVLITSENVSCTELGTVTATAMGGTPGDPDYFYEWNTGDTDPTLTDLPAGTYSVTAMDGNGCTGTASIEVTGALQPEVEITIDQPLTNNDPVGGQLSITITGGEGPFDILWNTGQTLNIIDNLGTGEYIVMITDANGCTATDTAYLFLPACLGGEVWHDLNRDDCQDAGEPGMAEVTLLLSGTDIWGNAITADIQTIFNGQYLFTDLPPGDYTVTLDMPAGFLLVDADACVNDFSDSDFSATLESPVISLAEGDCPEDIDAGIYDECLNATSAGEVCCDQYLCGPGNDAAPILEVVPASGAANPEYMWMASTSGGATNNGTWTVIPGAEGPDYDPGVLSETTFFIRCVRNEGCELWQEGNVVTIEVGTESVAEIYAPDGPICVGQTYFFMAAPAGPNATYSWDFGAGATPPSASELFAYVSWGYAGYPTLTLEVTDNGCTSSTSLQIAVSDNDVYCGGSSLQDVPGDGSPVELRAAGSADAPQFTLFPNPVREELIIDCGGVLPADLRMELRSVTGQLLQQLPLPDRSTRIKVADYPAGVYVVILRYADQVRVFRVVKQ